MYAGRLLARREYAVLELQARLLKKWAGEAHLETRVADFVEQLQAEGALSNERFAESFVRSRLLRFKGPNLVRSELRQRQVPEAIIEQSVIQDDEQWIALASKWLARQHSEPLDFSARAKYYRRLMNRGFNHHQAMAAVQSQSE